MRSSEPVLGREEIGSRLSRDPVYERWRWQIFAITWLAYAGFYLTRKSFAVAKIAIGPGTEIGLTQPQMAWIDGAFLVAYAMGQFLWGMAGDKFGTRKVIIAGMLCSVAAAMAMGAASLAITFALWFFIQGLAQSTGWAPLAKNIGNFFSRRERGTVIGLWCTNYAVGGLVASIYAGDVGQRFGWRYAFFIPAATLLLIWFLFVLFQRNRPEDVGLTPIEVYHAEPQPVLKPGEVPTQEPEGSWKVILQVLQNPVVLLLGAVYFCLKPARYAILFWGPKYINDRLGTGMAASGFLSAMFELAGPFSVLVAGIVSDKLFASRRMPVSVICLFFLGVLLFCLDLLPHTRWMLGGSLFLIGLLTYAPDSLISGTATIDFGTRRGASTASGLVNGCGSVGAIVGGTLPGLVQQQWGWHGVFTLLAGAVLLAALLLLPKWNALPPAAGSSTQG
jgi:OPA family sugar phosphate sensor protein UhpC-like MFS transporter